MPQAYTIIDHAYDVVVVGATSVLRGAVFGRRAGTHAAGLATR